MSGVVCCRRDVSASRWVSLPSVSTSVGLLAFGCFWLTSCVPSSQSIANDYRGPLNRVEANYEAMRFDVERSRGRRTGRCGVIYTTATFDTWKATRCGPLRLDQRRCMGSFIEWFRRAVARRYRYAQPDDVRRTCASLGRSACASFEVFERAYILSHNQRVSQAMLREMDAIVAQHADAQESAARRRVRRRRAAASLNATGRQMMAYGSESSSGSSTKSSPRAAGGCASDYDCRYGQKCVKGEHQFRGICAQPVDKLNLPTHHSPSTDSLGPGSQGNCHWNTDCGIGFKCVKQGSSLTGHCMR